MRRNRWPMKEIKEMNNPHQQRAMLEVSKIPVPASVMKTSECLPLPERFATLTTSAKDSSVSTFTETKRGSPPLSHGKSSRMFGMNTMSNIYALGGGSDVPSGRTPIEICTPLLMGVQKPKVPTNRTRSLSLSLSRPSGSRISIPSPSSALTSPRTPPTTPQLGRTGVAEWDAESAVSGVSGLSGLSLASSTCDHASVACNGTTFSGRSLKYVFHCSQHAGQIGEDYLTPTQRAQRQVRRLKTLLQQAQRDLDSRDSDIVKLTKEVVELRLYKAALSSPEERSNSSDVVTIKENQLEEDLNSNAADAHLPVDMSNSYTDSGHYEDFTNSSIHSKDSTLGDDFSPSPYKKVRPDTMDKSTIANLLLKDLECEHQELMSEYEKRIQNLVKSHETESYELRQRHNDKVEELLLRIGDINKKYWDLVPEFDNAKERICELEHKLENALEKLEEQEQKHKEAHLGHHAQKNEDQSDVDKLEKNNQLVEMIHQGACSKISVPDLLRQLQVTQAELENIRDIDYEAATSVCSPANNLQPLLSAKEAVTLWVLGARKAMYKQLMEAKNKRIDPEITLQFLKSAIFYFLTDKENSHGHLRAIQSILGFTPTEIANIEKARAT